MRKTLFVGTLALGALLGADGAQAQGMLPLAVEVRGGASFATGDFADVYDPQVGTSYGVNGQFQLLPMIGVYAGYERNEFSLDDEAGFGSDAELVDDGFSGGAQINIPFLPGLGPWVRGGVVYNKLTGEGGHFRDDDDTERKLGFEVGGGLSFPLGMVVSVTPGVRYRSYSPDSSEGGADDFDISYVVADLALRFSF